MTPVSTELRQALAQAGGAPLRLEDPESHAAYVLIRADQFEAIQSLLNEDHVARAYPLIDEAFRAGWGDPRMDDYDKLAASDTVALGRIDP